MPSVPREPREAHRSRRDQMKTAPDFSPGATDPPPPTPVPSGRLNPLRNPSEAPTPSDPHCL